MLPKGQISYLKQGISLEFVRANWLPFTCKKIRN
jgi:hypothetical protein